MLLPLLETWYACAQQLGDVELSVRLVLEMLAHGQSYVLRFLLFCAPVDGNGTLVVAV